MSPLAPLASLRCGPTFSMRDNGKRAAGLRAAIPRGVISASSLARLAGSVEAAMTAMTAPPSARRQPGVSPQAEGCVRLRGVGAHLGWPQRYAAASPQISYPRLLSLVRKCAAGRGRAGPGWPTDQLGGGLLAADHRALPEAARVPEGSRKWRPLLDRPAWPRRLGALDHGLRLAHADLPTVAIAEAATLSLKNIMT